MGQTEKEILHTIERAKHGTSLADLALKHPSVPRRTLQRMMSSLISSGIAEARGMGRSRSYFHARRSVKSDPHASKHSFPEELVPSSESKQIIQYLKRPPSSRSPVGYERSFLESYEPNKTFYVPEKLRRELHQIGHTGNEGLAAGTYGREIVSRMLIDLSWSSSALEGNTYSRLDTLKLIESGKKAAGKDAIETQMILNHKSAIEFVLENAAEIRFDRMTLLNLHAILAENLLQNAADEGRLRQHAVAIGMSVYRPIAAFPVLEELFNLLLRKTSRIRDPFEQAFFIMVHLPYLQPFADGNKRTSRLAANIPLVKKNLCPLTFLDVPEFAYSSAILGIYEINRFELLRDVFVWSYRRSCREYLALKQDIAQPDPIRLKFRETMKRIVAEVVVNLDRNPSRFIDKELNRENEITKRERLSLKKAIEDELAQLHEGILFRYGLRPSQFERWRNNR